MIDVRLPTTHGREIILTRYTQPEPELQLLQTHSAVPAAPKITTAALTQAPTL